MRYARVFRDHDPATHAHPWLAVVTRWPDQGPPALRFGERVQPENIPPVGCVLAGLVPGDVVRWGARSLATKATDPATEGWGTMQPDGSVMSCTKDEARAMRRRAHPEDAQLPAGTIPPAKRGRRVVVAHKPRNTGAVLDAAARPDPNTGAVLDDLRALAEAVAPGCSPSPESLRDILHAAVARLDQDWTCVSGKHALAEMNAALVGTAPATRNETPVVQAEPAPTRTVPEEDATPRALAPGFLDTMQTDDTGRPLF